ncbi:AAA family ATPase, partial [uncultured Arthrobacter sp.]|uniref:AAA family ATPase n=1 Tax=uncultured Arthrobacter sp. TaxID=114050 RepID=UPI00321664D4
MSTVTEELTDEQAAAALEALVAEAETKTVKKAPAKKAAAPKKALFDLSSIAGVTIGAPRAMSSKFSMVIYGGKGVGKTSLLGDCANVPAWAPILILATEDGASVLHRDYGNNPLVQVVNLEDWKTAAPLIQAVADNETEFKTVAIDTLPELQELNKAHITDGGSNEMRIQDWGTLADNTINVVKMLHRSPYVNVIFTAHVEKVQDDAGKVLYSPYLLG